MAKMSTRVSVPVVILKSQTCHLLLHFLSKLYLYVTNVGTVTMSKLSSKDYQILLTGWNMVTCHCLYVCH